MYHRVQTIYSALNISYTKISYITKKYISNYIAIIFEENLIPGSPEIYRRT